MNAHVFSEQAGKLRFVGDFEALYASESDPWGQSGNGPMAGYYEASRKTLLDVLRRLAFGNGLEIGCGHGHLTEQLQTGLYSSRVTGMDISAAAVRHARVLHPGVRFLQADIADKEFAAAGQFGFVLWAQILWYVLERADVAIRNTISCIEPGGLFVISQAFLDEQRYGREIADGFAGVLKLMGKYADRLTLIEARYDDSERFQHHDGLLVFRRVG